MAVCKERAWKTLTELSFERVTGTEEELKAANYLLEECKKAGVEATLEAYEIDMTEISEASLTVVSTGESIPCIGIGKTGQTGDEGICGPLAYVENGEDANFYDIEGKICLIQGRTTPEMMKKMKEAGAIGFITMHGSFYDAKELVSELRPRDTRGEDFELPGLVVHINDAEKLVLSMPCELKMVLKEETKKGTAHNVVATIPGTKYPNEILAFSAHYDSVRYSSGAWDNATGSITILELMHHFNEEKPLRTVKFVWCGSEEIGLVGSREYCKAHESELKDYFFNINFDMTGVTLGYEYLCCSASDEVLHAIQYVAKCEGYPMVSKMDLYPSDSTSFAMAGVPACTFARLQPNGGKQIHNRYDDMNHMDPDSFMITLNFVVKFASQVLNAPVNVIPRKFSEGLTKTMEQRKKMFASMIKKEEPKKEESKEEESKEEIKEESK